MVCGWQKQSKTSFWLWVWTRFCSLVFRQSGRETGALFSKSFESWFRELGLQAWKSCVACQRRTVCSESKNLWLERWQVWLLHQGWWNRTSNLVKTETCPGTFRGSWLKPLTQKTLQTLRLRLTAAQRQVPCAKIVTRVEVEDFCGKVTTKTRQIWSRMVHSIVILPYLEVSNTKKDLGNAFLGQF